MAYWDLARCEQEKEIHTGEHASLEVDDVAVNTLLETGDNVVS